VERELQRMGAVSVSVPWAQTLEKRPAIPRFAPRSARELPGAGPHLAARLRVGFLARERSPELLHHGAGDVVPRRENGSASRRRAPSGPATFVYQPGVPPTVDTDCHRA